MVVEMKIGDISGGLYTCERRYLGLCVSMRIEDIGPCSALGSGQRGTAPSYLPPPPSPIVKLPVHSSPRIRKRLCQKFQHLAQ